jgi:ribonuclease HI
VLTRRKLRHYFEGHPVTVVSSFPLGEIVQNREASGRIAKWTVELMGETLSYAPRKEIKSQVLVDFLAEWTDTQLPPAQIQAKLWTMYFDGSLMKTGAGTGLLFISPLGIHMRYVIRLHFAASNNVAEYEALINGLRIAVELRVRHLNVRGDSQLVIDQVMKDSSCHNPKMESYYKEEQCLEDKFHDLELNHIACRYNEAADELTKITSSRPMVPPDVFSRDLHEPSVDLRATEGVDNLSLNPPLEAEAPSTGADVKQTEGSTPPANFKPDWRISYLDCLIRGELSPGKTEARRIARRAKTFVTYGNDKELYRRSPWASYSAVSQSRKAGIYSEIYSQGLAVIMWRLEPSSEMCSGKASIGQPRSLMPLSWYAPAKDASTMRGRPISRLMPCKPSPSHGHSPFGGSTWSDP